MKKQFKLKVISIIVCVFLTLLGLEFFLRFLGFTYNFTHRLPKNAEGDYKIFCVGESTTWGVGASNELKENYPKQLEEILNEQFSGKKFVVFYDQTIGQNTSEILMKLPRYIDKYHPKMMIFMVGANNWWNMDTRNFLIFNKNNRISGITLKAMVFLDKFRLWKLFKWTGLSLLSKARWNYYFPANVKIESLMEKVVRSYGLDIFIEIAEYDLREMIKICKYNEIKVIICGYPGGSFERLDLAYELIAKEFNIPYVNNKKFFKNIPNANYYFSADKWHPNEKGYRLIAENVYSRIKDIIYEQWP